MTKKTKAPKRALCALLAVALMLGATFAYFSDYATTSVTGTAGTVAVAMDSNINLLDADGKDIINPGDMRDGSFEVTNEGNKSIDVRTTIVLTAQSEHFDLTFSGDGATQSEYDLYMREDVEFVEGRGYMPKAGAQPLQVKSIDGDVITYILPEYSLNGNSDLYNEVETIDGVDAFSKVNDFVFIMKGEAGNEWQDSAVSIDVLVEAKQHENTGAGWDIVAQENISVGNINQSAVKGENVITEAEATTSKITVVSKDANGNDLNASASVIKGAKADELLDALEESGLANKEDVDILIDVESDDFDGMADTTFDVSDLAEDGDTAVILHYDEAKGEWEYIATETVVDGKVSGDFSSYSPVAIQIIKKEESGEDAPELNPDAVHTLDPLWRDTVGIQYKKLVFTNGEVPAGVEAQDVSADKDGSILAYKDNLTMYITTPDNGVIAAPESAGWMFGNLYMVEEIHFHNFDFSAITDASDMFIYSTADVFVDEVGNNLVVEAFTSTDAGVTVKALAECAGHETAGCDHVNGMANPMTSTTHDFYCYDCNQSIEQECVFSAETGKCEQCSNTSLVCFMPMSSEWQSLWLQYSLNDKVAVGDVTVTVADIEAMYAAQGYDLAADGKAVAGITKVRNGELSQSVIASAGETVYIVLADAATEIPEGVDIDALAWDSLEMEAYMGSMPVNDIAEYVFVSTVADIPEYPEDAQINNFACFRSVYDADTMMWTVYAVAELANDYQGYSDVNQWIVSADSYNYEMWTEEDYMFFGLAPVNMDAVIVY